MKKLLLPALIAAMALPAAARTETQTMLGEALCGVSPKGDYAASEYYGSVTVFDLNTGDRYDYPESSSNSYTLGNGNFFSNGKMVCSLDDNGKMGVWRPTTGNPWTVLNTLISDPGGFGSANGITPDSKRICGNASTGAGFAMDEYLLMVSPCYWDALPVGNGYGSQQILPHPTEDMFGLKPQYVTAVSISEDGKTIVGQIVSGSGFHNDLILYRQAEDGSWSYSLPIRDLMNPNHIEIPPFPGEGPMIPSQEDYMTEAELEAYDEAVAKYQADPNNIPMPKYEDYMTAEEIAAYNAELEKVANWSTEFENYMTTVNKIIAESPNPVFNLVRISPSGRYVAFTSAISSLDPETFARTSYYTPYLLDTTTGECIQCGIEGYSVAANAVNNDGDMLCYRQMGDANVGMVRNHETGEYTDLSDYLIARDPALEDWVKENWRHTMEVVIDEQTGETEFMDLDITGYVWVSDDWTTFVSYTYIIWPSENIGNLMSYVVKLDSAEDGIEAVSTAKEADEWFDLQGRKVSNPTRGIYITNGRKILR